MERKFTVEMTKGAEVYYPAESVRGGSDFTANRAAARRMTKGAAEDMVARIGLFSTGITGKVVTIG